MKLYEYLLNKYKDVSVNQDTIRNTFISMGTYMSPGDVKLFGKWICALIHHHSIIEGKETDSPYGSKIMAGGNCIIFKFSNIPSTLQKVLYGFVLEYSE